MAARAAQLLSRQGRLTIRTAIAPGPLAASVLARHRQPSLIITPDGADAAAALAHAVGPLPIEAIVEDHPQAVQGLARLGIRRIDALNALPRQSVAERFGPDVIAALDRLYGRMADPLHPRRPPAAVEARISWAEPIGRAEDIAAATASLVDRLAGDLATAGLGARQLLLSAHIVDGAVRSAELGLAMASRDPVHLMRLLAERLDRIDPGLGIEVMVLSAPRVQRLGVADRALPGLVSGALPGLISCALPGLSGRGQAVPAGQPVAIAALIDRIDARLGSGRVRAVQIDAAVLPEAVARLVSATGQAIGLDNLPTRAPAALDGPHRPTAPDRHGCCHDPNRSP
ncbi:Y-family DNA polymerase [Tistrella bauzanensis]